MAESIGATVGNAILDCYFNATNITAPANNYMKLHIGAPGAAGASNAAAETLRKSVSYGAAASGAISSDAAVTWTSITGSEDATHFSTWIHLTNSASTDFVCSGTITANAYVGGDTLTFASGDIDLAFTLAS